MPGMRVAVLADIHGNLPALEAVLRDVRAAGVDAIVLNGDIATGPMPAQTLDALIDLGETAIWVHGNCERELLTAYDTGAPDPELPEVAAAPAAYGASRLAAHHRERLADLPLSVTLDVTGLGPVRFCHATTRSDTEIVLVDSPVSRFSAGFADTTEATLVLGHTHMPFDRLADRRRFVNPGSVGMPYGPPGTVAYWALLGPGVTLHRTAYDLEGAAERMRASAWPGNAEFIQQNLLGGPPSDTEALAVFTTWAWQRRGR